MAGRGHPRSFESGEQLVQLWTDFCREIVKNDYNIAPTYTEFSAWLSDGASEADRKTIYTSLNKYFPEIKNSVETIRADVVAQGTMLGKYQPSMSIFALKNWCGWADKVEAQNTNKNVDLSGLTSDEIRELLYGAED
jgi:hypothetical protein